MDPDSSGMKESQRQYGAYGNTVLNSQLMRQGQEASSLGAESKNQFLSSVGNYPSMPRVPAPTVTSAFSAFIAPSYQDRAGLFEVKQTDGSKNQNESMLLEQDFSMMSVTSQSAQPSAGTDLSAARATRVMLGDAHNITTMSHIKPPVCSVTSKTESPLKQDTYMTEIDIPDHASGKDLFTLNQTDVDLPTQDRQLQLQHYIKMLLDKSPGEPLDAPMPTLVPLEDRIQPVPPPEISSLSPIVTTTEVKVVPDEDKENEQDERFPSEIAIGVMNFLNQQLAAQKPSPDVIPQLKTTLFNSANRSPKHQTQQNRQKTSQKNPVFQPSKLFTGLKSQLRTSNASFKKPNAPSNQSLQADSSNAQLTMKDLGEDRAKPSNNQQLGDISSMLGAYMSGDTQEAAQKLLFYLAESQSKANHDASLNSSKVSQKKNKTKTPSKSLPAWR